jgi:hypothetical protein
MFFGADTVVDREITKLVEKHFFKFSASLKFYPESNLYQPCFILIFTETRYKYEMEGVLAAGVLVKVTLRSPYICRSKIDMNWIGNPNRHLAHLPSVGNRTTELFLL